jgi:hypothetical protein
VNRRAAAARAAAAALALLGVAALSAAAAAPDGYADSVDRALQVLRAAPAGDGDAARRAAAELEAGTGESQREILADLRAAPPNVADARTRLTALARADRSPAFVPEPARAQRTIHSILAQPRYAAMRQGPSLGDRIRDALLSLLAWLLERAGAVGPALWWPLVAGAVVTLAAVAVVVARAALGSQARRGARLAPGGPAAARARDHFGDADRLAAAGDLTGAVRALAGGVAAALGDERDWEASPLTVREIFARAPDAAALRPLLLAFESAVYGGRPPDADSYRRAASAAAVFRTRDGRQVAA